MQQQPPDPRERPLNPNLSSTYSKFGNQPPVYQPQPPQPEQYQPPQWQSQQYPYPQPQPQYTPPPMVQPPPPKKKSRKKLWLIIGAIIIVLIIVANIGAHLSPSSTDTTPQATQPAQTTQATQAVQPTQPPAKPTAVPTQAPTASPAQAEQAYKASATDTTVTNLDKDGNSDQGNIVHFTATILNFVKDDSGNTAGANVDDPNSAGSVIQVLFPASTDITQLNQGDTLEVWGQDMGTASGTNAFGATIQEVVITGQYMRDQTTNYQAGP